MILVACFVFDLKTALYSFVGLAVKSFMIDDIITTINLRKSITIVCDDKEPICSFITAKLNRSATITEGVGAYTNGKNISSLLPLPHPGCGTAKFHPRSGSAGIYVCFQHQ